MLAMGRFMNIPALPISLFYVETLGMIATVYRVWAVFNSLTMGVLDGGVVSFAIVMIGAAKCRFNRVVRLATAALTNPGGQNRQWNPKNTAQVPR